MSDEAFARRFYSDRAELVALGVPLDSQRDEFTGEELYTLRSERYFLPELELDDEELAALQTCFFLLEGRFAYAEPLRLALQNLALGRSAGALAAAPTRDCGARRGARSGLLARAAGPARQARGRDLEAAHGQVPVLVDLSRPGGGADAESVRAPARERLLVRDRPRSRPRRHQDVPRLAHPLRHPLRDAPRARLPAAARVRRRELPRPRGVAVRRHRRRRRASRSRPTPPGGSSAPSAASATASRTTSSSPSTRRRRCSPAGSSARTAARSRSSRRSCAASSSRVRAPRAPRTKARRRRRPPRSCRARRDAAPSGPPGPVAPERFGVLQSLLAYLLAACGDDREATIPAQELVERFSIAEDQLEEHLSLLEPRQLRRRLLRGLRGAARRRGARRQGALRRHVPPSAAPDAARGARDPACARVRRADGRRRCALAARPRAREARGDIRRVRAHADARAARRRRGRSRRQADAGDRRAPPRRDRVPEAGGAGGHDAHGRAVLDRAPSSPLVRAHVGHRARPAALVPPRPHAQGERAPEDVQAARRVRSVRAALGDDARASGTRRTSRAGRSRRAPARSSTAQRSPTSRSGAPTGWSARSSRTAARRSCSSRTSCAHASPIVHASSRRSSAPPAPRRRPA